MSPIALAFLLGLPTAPPTPTTVAVESVDVLPVAVIAVARADGRPGPCGPRALLAVAREDVDAFVAGRTVTTTPMPDDAWPVDIAAGITGGPTLLLSLWAGPGLFSGEAAVFALSVDAALAKAKLTTTATTTLVWRDRQPFLRIATSAPAEDVATALRAFVPTTAQLTAFEAGVARQRLGQARFPGARALERVDAQLCLGARATMTTTTLTPAIVRAALAAPLSPG
jgi:hypothetical protein